MLLGTKKTYRVLCAINFPEGKARHHFPSLPMATDTVSLYLTVVTGRDICFWLWDLRLVDLHLTHSLTGEHRYMSHLL